MHPYDASMPAPRTRTWRTTAYTLAAAGTAGLLLLVGAAIQGGLRFTIPAGLAVYLCTTANLVGLGLLCFARVVDDQRAGLAAVLDEVRRLEQTLLASPLADAGKQERAADFVHGVVETLGALGVTAAAVPDNVRQMPR